MTDSFYFMLQLVLTTILNNSCVAVWHESATFH